MDEVRIVAHLFTAPDELAIPRAGCVTSWRPAEEVLACKQPVVAVAHSRILHHGVVMH